MNIALWGILIKQNKIDEALFAAEKVRAEALMDLLESKYRLFDEEQAVSQMLPKLSSNTVFLTIGRNEIYVWILLQGKRVHFAKQYLGKDTIKYLDWPG